MNGDLVRGNVDTIILKCLENGELYGLQICNFVDVASEGTYSLKKPTLYSALTRLQKMKFIRERTEQSPIGGERHYYALTDTGREYLESKKFEWVNSKSVIDNLVFAKPSPAVESNVLPMPADKTVAASAVVGTFIDTYAKERAMAERITASANTAVATKPAQIAMTAVVSPVATSIAVETREPSRIEEYAATAGGFITLPLKNDTREVAEVADNIVLFRPFVKHANDPRNGKFVFFNRLRMVVAGIVSLVLAGALGIAGLMLKDSFTTMESNFLSLGFLAVAVYFLYNAVLFGAYPKYKQIVTHKSNGIMRRMALTTCIAVGSLSICILAGLSAVNAADYVVYWVVPWIVGSLFVLEGVTVHFLRRSPYFLT